jgi:hypothetical protein
MAMFQTPLHLALLQQQADARACSEAGMAAASELLPPLLPQRDRDWRGVWLPLLSRHNGGRAISMAQQHHDEATRAARGGVLVRSAHRHPLALDVGFGRQPTAMLAPGAELRVGGDGGGTYGAARIRVACPTCNAVAAVALRPCLRQLVVHDARGDCGCLPTLVRLGPRKLRISAS